MGGMATVFLATDLKHNRSVALKLMRSDLYDAAGAHRFLREISIAANLTHPHIVALHDSGEVDGILYYVMPFIDGPTLRTKLRMEGRLETFTAHAQTHLARYLPERVCGEYLEELEKACRFRQ